LVDERTVRRRGFTLVYFAVALAVLIALGSLAVDVGRYQAARAELQAAADAIALHAAAGLSDNSALSRAQSLAAESASDLLVVTLQPSDVQTGRWDLATGVFTPGASPANAVQVTLVRSAGRGNALPLGLARAIGVSSTSLRAQSIAFTDASPDDADPGKGLVGLASVNLSGGARVAAFDADAGTVRVQSNGNWNLSGSARIVGDAAHHASPPPAGFVSGAITRLASPLSFPAATLPATYTSHGNANLAGQTRLRLPPGNHYFTSLSANGNARLEVANADGPVRIYVAGSFSWGGNSVLAVEQPFEGFEVYVLGGGGIDLNGYSDLVLALYAPQSPLNMNSNARLRGTAIVQSIHMSTATRFDYDERIRASTAPPGTGGNATGGNGGTSRVSLVR
jgi:Flp pilus assembly protein TadG